MVQLLSQGSPDLNLSKAGAIGEGTYQELVEVLDVVWLEEGQVAGGLVVDLLHGAVLCLHVEACHAADGCGGGLQLAGRGADGHVASWWRQHLRTFKAAMTLKAQNLKRKILNESETEVTFFFFQHFILICSKSNCSTRQSHKT